MSSTIANWATFWPHILLKESLDMYVPLIQDVNQAWFSQPADATEMTERAANLYPIV